jgi:hypothetical protein
MGSETLQRGGLPSEVTCSKFSTAYSCDIRAQYGARVRESIHCRSKAHDRNAGWVGNEEVRRA